MKWSKQRLEFRNTWTKWKFCADEWDNEFSNYYKKKVFYLYDLNWHEKSLNYKFTLDAIESADVLVCRSKEHADKIEEYSGRRPLIISEINFEEVLNDTSGCSK